jgi:hypothetical protein
MSEQNHDNNALATLAAALISAAVTMACSVNQFSNYQPQLSIKDYKLILKQPAIEKKDSTIITIVPSNTQAAQLQETETTIKPSSDTAPNDTIISNVCCIEPNQNHYVTANKKQHQVFYDPVSTIFVSFEQIDDGYGIGYWGNKDSLSVPRKTFRDGQPIAVKVCDKNYQILFNSFKLKEKSYNISIIRTGD